MFGFDVRKLPFRQRRLFVGIAHVSPEDPALFLERVGLELDVLAKVGFFGGHVDALAGDVEFPAMIRTAQTAFLVAPEPQRRTPVGAQFIHQPESSFGVAKGDEFFRQQLHAHRRTVGFWQFVCKQCRDPVTAENCPHRRAGPGLGDQIISFFSQHQHYPFDVFNPREAGATRTSHCERRTLSLPAW